MTETTTTVEATTITTKPEHKQISNYVGAAVAIFGIVAPAINPELLAFLYVPAPVATAVCIIVGGALGAYREKTKVSAVSSTTTTT